MGAAQGAWVKGKEEGLTAHKHQAYEVPHEFIYIYLTYRISPHIISCILAYRR